MVVLTSLLFLHMLLYYRKYKVLVLFSLCMLLSSVMFLVAPSPFPQYPHLSALLQIKPNMVSASSFAQTVHVPVAGESPYIHPVDKNLQAEQFGSSLDPFYTEWKRQRRLARLHAPTLTEPANAIDRSPTDLLGDSWLLPVKPQLSHLTGSVSSSLCIRHRSP